jgi:hypothetical protein
MKYIPLVFLIIALCIFPCMAATYSGTAPSGQAIWALDITAQYGSTGTILLNLENGNTVSGSWVYSGILPPTLTTSLGGDSSSYAYVTPLPVHLNIWNGDNVTYARELKMGYGQFAGGWNDVLTTSIAASPVLSYTITSDKAVTVSPEYTDYSTAVTNLNYKPEDWIGKIKEYLPLIWLVFESLLYWLKFLFVDNLVLTVSLYMAGTMAYAANTSKDIFKVFSTWFRQQRALFEFMAQGFAVTFQIVVQTVQVVTSVVGAIASKLLGL